MKKIILLLFSLSIILLGCSTTKPNPILSSNEESWFIPKGTPFQAKKKPDEPLQTYQVNSDDLMILYKGAYLELEKKANSCSR